MSVPAMPGMADPTSKQTGSMTSTKRRREVVSVPRMLKDIKHLPNHPSLAPHKKSSRRKRISVTLDASVVAALDERGHHRGEQIMQDLRRYYRLLAEGRLALQARLSTEN